MSVNRWRRCATLACLGWVAIPACSGSPAGPPDAGAPDAEPAIAPPVPPAPPAAPVLTPCPAGWREVADGDVVTCDPWPEGGALACASDEAHFPGEPGCARIGPACPADGWPADVPEGKPVLWVRAGSAPGGTGTKASPFATIGAAVSVATSGTTIAVATGLYEEGFTLGDGEVVLQGACVAGTRVAALVPSDTAGTIHVTSPGVEIRDLSLGGPRLGLMVLGGGSVHLENVVIAGATGLGILVDGGTLTAVTLAIRDTAPRAADGRFGRGLDAEGGGQVDLARGAFERNRDQGIYAGAGTTVVLSDVVVRDTEYRALDGAFGRGLNAEAGAHVEVSRAAFQGNRDIGIGVFDAATTATITDVAVRDTRSRANGTSGGRGVAVEGGALLELARATLDRNREAGVFAMAAGTTLTLSHVVVRDTLSRELTETDGFGLSVLDGARVDALATVWQRNRSIGVVASGAGTTVTMSDLRVSDTLSEQISGVFGRGVTAYDAAHVEVERAVLERNRGAGLFALEPGTTLLASDVVVRDTRSRDLDGIYGRGLHAYDGVHVEITRAIFERNRDFGVFAHGTSTTVVLTDLTVVDTLDQECRASGTCPWSTTSHVGSYDGASVELRRFELRRGAFLGVQIAPVPPELFGKNIGGTIDLHEGVVADNPIGINIQSEGFDLARIRDRVVWGPNVVNLVTDALPVPGTGGP